MMSATYREPVTLLGGFNCELNLEEHNQWIEFIVNHEMYKEYANQALISKHCGDSIQKLEAAKKQQDLYVKLFYIGKEWFHSLHGEVKE